MLIKYVHFHESRFRVDSNVGKRESALVEQFTLCPKSYQKLSAANASTVILTGDGESEPMRYCNSSETKLYR